MAVQETQELRTALSAAETKLSERDLTIRELKTCIAEITGDCSLGSSISQAAAIASTTDDADVNANASSGSTLQPSPTVDVYTDVTQPDSIRPKLTRVYFVFYKYLGIYSI